MVLRSIRRGPSTQPYRCGTSFWLAGTAFSGAFVALIAAFPQIALAACLGENTGNVICDAANPATDGALVSAFAGTMVVTINPGAKIDNFPAFLGVFAPGTLTVTNNDTVFGIPNTTLTLSNDFGDVNYIGNAPARGILAGNNTGNGNVSIVNSATIGTDGINALANGNGKISIDSAANIFGPVIGQTNGAGDVVITGSGSVTSTAIGIGAAAFGTGNATIDYNGTIASTNTAVSALAVDGNATVMGFGSVTSTNQGGTMFAQAGGSGNALIAWNGTVGNTGASGIGLGAVATGTGSATLNVLQNVTSNAGAFAANAIFSTVSGLATATVAAGVAIGGGAAGGLWGVSTSGNMDVAIGDGASISGNSLALRMDTGGISTTTIGAGAIVSGGQGGLNARATGGSLTIGNGAAVTASGGLGINVQSTAGFTLFNAGNVAGFTAAIAFQENGGLNTLTLAPTSVISGQVIGGASPFQGAIGGAPGVADTLQLGGTGTGTFDVSLIGDAAQYSGFGTFNKVDSSIWTLTGTPGQATSWSINGGTLSVANDISLGAANEALSFNGGILQVTGTGFTSTPRALNWGAGGGGFDIADPTNTFTVSQALTGPGGLAKLGAGTLVMSGANSYRGNTLVNAGTLRQGSAGSFSANSSFAVGSGATLNLGGLDATIGSLSGEGSVLLGTARLTAGGDNTSTAFSGSLSGSGGLTKAGTGAMTLTGTNTYSGATIVSGGSLRGGATNAFSPSSALTLRAGGTLDLNGFTETVASLSGGGNVLGAGTLISGGNNTSTTFSGTFSGTGSFTKTGTGTTTFSGTNTYSGPTSVSSGTLQAGATNTFSAFSAVTLSSGALLDLNGFTNTIGSLSGTGNVLGAGTLIAGGNNASTTFSGTISGNGGFTKSGTGTTTFSGANTYSGPTSVSSGTLQAGATNTFSTFSAVTLSSGALVDLNGFSNAIGSLSGTGNVLLGAATLTAGQDNTSTTFAGTMSGNGGFTKIGTGTTMLTGANSYTGATSITAGTLQVGNSGTAGTLGTGNVINNAALAFNRSDAVIVANAISGTGNVIQNGTGTTALTGANSYTGATSITAGTLQVGNGGTTGTLGTGNVINNAALSFNRSDSVVFTNAISGSGNVIQNGAQLDLAGINTYRGTTTVNAGTLSVNGSIALSSLVQANDGTTLSGNGTVGNTLINGGTLSPGNSIGLLNVSGSLTFTAAATYLVQVSGTTSDRTSVIGTITAAGRIAVDPLIRLNQTTTYTIINAAARNGTFDSATVANNFARNARLSYVGGDILLTLDPGLLSPILPANASTNQKNVAAGIDNALEGGAALPAGFNGLFNLSGNALLSALTQASGETETGTQQTTFDAMGLFMGLMTDPFVAGRGDGVASKASDYADEALGYAATRRPSDAMAVIYRKAPPLIAQPLQRWSVWSAGFGGSQTTSGNAALGSNTVMSRIYGGAVGLDYRVSPYTLAGVALAGGGTNFNVANGGIGRSDLFQAGGFVRHNVGATYLTGTLAYGWQDVTTERSVGADRLGGRFSTDAFSGRIEAGHRLLDSALGIGVTPYAAAQFTTVHLPNYSETAGVANAFGLSYASKDITASRSEIGFRGDKSYGVGEGVLTLRGRAAWAHNFNPDRSIAATFQTLPGASFVVNGAAQARDAALVTASAEMTWNSGWAVAATFEGEFSNVTRSYAGKGVARYQW